MLHRFCLFVILCCHLIPAQAADDQMQVVPASTSDPITFKDCFVLNKATIPGHSNMHWHPFYVAQRIAVFKELEGKATKHHLAPSGGYFYHDLKAYVGFVGAPSASLAHGIAESLSADDALVWHDCLAGSMDIDDAFKTIIAAYLLAHHNDGPPVSFHIMRTDNLSRPIIAPARLHKTFKKHKLNPKHAEHRNLLAFYAEHSGAGYQEIPYLELQPEQLERFYAQEAIGERILQK